MRQAVLLMLDRGFGGEYARFLAAALQDVAEGRLVIPVSEAVEGVCGRRPFDVHQFVANFARSLCGISAG